MLKLLIALAVFAAEPAASIRPITFQLPVEPDTIDPAHVSDVYGYNIAANVNEGLVRLNGKGELVNGLAAAYTISRDGRIYRFRLRKDAKWSDGQPITIADCLRGLRLRLDPKTTARDASYFSAVKELRQEKDELVIELKEPDTAILQALSMPLATPAREGKWEATGPSTGAYRVAYFKPDREIRLEPNPFYPAKATPITFKVIAEENTALNLFETGQLDAISTIPLTEVARLKKAGLVVESPGAAAFYLKFNLQKAPFSEVRWRKALAAAVNRENLAKLAPETLSVTGNYLPRAVEGSGAQLHPDFSAELQWAKAQKMPEVALVYPATNLSSMVAQRLQNDIQQNLGLRIQLEPMEWKAYSGRMQADAPALFYGGYGAPFNDPLSHLKVFVSGEADNRMHYANPSYDQLVAQVKHLPRGKAREAALRKAQNLLVAQDAVVVPLTERKQATALANGIAGYQINPYGVVDLRELRRK